jgi:antitoxin component YwqK of YwqJK toxin-antitoxin module
MKPFLIYCTGKPKQMKLKLLLFALALYCNTFAQPKEIFYDFFWKESSPENATYYGVKLKTDSGWLQTNYYILTKKLQMTALYTDEACKVHHGHVYYYHANGIPSAIGRMINNKKEGVCLSYHSNGIISDSALFKNGKVVDKRFQWHRNGMMSDSISRINDSTYVHIGWFEDGNISYAGYEVNEKQNGKWQYFHHNGQVSALETYTHGKLVKAEYFDEQGQALKDTSMVNREVTFKGGQAAWTKYLGKNLYWPEGLKFTTPASVTVGVSFWVDENGKVSDAEVYLPFHSSFDKIALKTIKNSPDWLPAISHNRKVRVQRRQPVIFAQPE